MKFAGSEEEVCIFCCNLKPTGHLSNCQYVAACRLFGFPVNGTVLDTDVPDGSETHKRVWNAEALDDMPDSDRRARWPNQ